MILEDEQFRDFAMKARDEIGESNVDMEQCLITLKTILYDSYVDLRLPPSSDQLLLRCLRVRKFDIQRSAKLVHQYFKLLWEISDMHKYLVPSLLADLYKQLGISTLKHRDSKGRVVLLARQEKVPPDVYNFDQALAGTILMIDSITQNSADNQRLGIVLVCDWKGYTLAHFRQASASRLRSAAKLFQDAFPARFKEIHFIRNPVLITCFFAIVKPFLREKIKNRVHFHGHDFESFYKFFSPDIMPQFLGGNLPNDEYADMDFTNTLIRSDDYYTELLQHGYKSCS